MLSIIAICFVAGLAIVPFLRTERLARTACLIAAVVPAGTAAWFLRHLPAIIDGSVLEEHHMWIPSLGADLVFRLDGLSLTFSLLITAIGAVVSLYAAQYFHEASSYRKFFPPFLVFMGAMLGLVLSDNLLALFVFWELTSLSSYYLIGYYHERESARQAALQALLITGGGGLLLMAGFLMMGMVGQSFEISALMNSKGTLLESSVYPWIAICVLLGAFTKSAQFPFQFWLPSAMAAPTPVSAYLHSATMVKAGIYLLARLTPVLGDTPLWQITIATVGLITFALGAWLSPLQFDLKRMLATSTLSGLGLLTFLIGLGSPLAFKAMLAFLVVHALYKAALFLTVGNLDHGANTRDVLELGGLRAKMPWTGIAAALGAIAMMGLPPALGFLAKELLYESSLEAGLHGHALGHLITALAPAVLVFGNALIFCTAVIVGFRPFVGSGSNDAKARTRARAHEASFCMWAGPLFLSTLGIVFGLLEGAIPQSVLSPGLRSLGVASEAKPFEFWHGFNLAFVMSLATFALGIVATVIHARAIDGRMAPTFSLKWPIRGEQVFQAGLGGLLAFAKRLTKALQNGELSSYVQITAAAALIWLGLSFPSERLATLQNVTFEGSSVPFTLAIVLTLAGTAFVLQAKQALTAIVGLGAVGYGVALFFGDQGAPDLALTQAAVETLSVLLFAYNLHRLPIYAKKNVRRHMGRQISRQTSRHAVIAIAFGVFLTGVTLLATETQAPSRLRGFFEENSLVQAHGRNIVNVILVDFRGLDTMGEITVLGIAALGVSALLFKRKREETP